MYKLNFDVEVIGLDNKVIEDFKLYEFFGNALVASPGNEDKNELMKFMEWGRKVYTDKFLIVDSVDKSKLESFAIQINTSRLVKSNLISVMEKAEKIEVK